MEIKLSIKQDDIEQAIRDYVVSKGITTPVREINFQVSRKGGFALTAEVEVSETPVEASTPDVKTEDTTPEPVADKPKSKPAKATKPAVTEVDETPTPEPVKEEDDKPPFTPDGESANDADAPEQKKASDSKSLFG